MCVLFIDCSFILTAYVNFHFQCVCGPPPQHWMPFHFSLYSRCEMRIQAVYILIATSGHMHVWECDRTALSSTSVFRFFRVPFSETTDVPYNQATHRRKKSACCYPKREYYLLDFCIQNGEKINKSALCYHIYAAWKSLIRLLKGE